MINVFYECCNYNTRLSVTLFGEDRGRATMFNSTKLMTSLSIFTQGIILWENNRETTIILYDCMYEMNVYYYGCTIVHQKRKENTTSRVLKPKVKATIPWVVTWHQKVVNPHRVLCSETQLYTTVPTRIFNSYVIKGVANLYATFPLVSAAWLHSVAQQPHLVCTCLPTSGLARNSATSCVSSEASSWVYCYMHYGYKPIANPLWSAWGNCWYR